MNQQPALASEPLLPSHCHLFSFCISAYTSIVSQSHFLGEVLASSNYSRGISQAFKFSLDSLHV